jgi:hypothetical protein
MLSNLIHEQIKTIRKRVRQQIQQPTLEIVPKQMQLIQGIIIHKTTIRQQAQQQINNNVDDAQFQLNEIACQTEIVTRWCKIYETET